MSLSLLILFTCHRKQRLSPHLSISFPSPLPWQPPSMSVCLSRRPPAPLPVCLSVVLALYNFSFLCPVPVLSYYQRLYYFFLSCLTRLTSSTFIHLSHLQCLLVFSLTCLMLNLSSFLYLLLLCLIYFTNLYHLLHLSFS